ncbi:hypothetical protein EVAR_92769_1 [Eumeta japonica]|uniref:Uncharacterized protein n=1 Tax=Eumeta variegata TaxID=151549 RepID=A0A4C1T019_EUMVA|nr:hypothetical protein EVAR_92769_1 [Eumeta japonica]
MTPTPLPDARPLVACLAPAEHLLSRAYKPRLDRHSDLSARIQCNNVCDAAAATASLLFPPERLVRITIPRAGCAHYYPNPSL